MPFRPLVGAKPSSSPSSSSKSTKNENREGAGEEDDAVIEADLQQQKNLKVKEISQIRFSFFGKNKNANTNNFYQFSRGPFGCKLPKEVVVVDWKSSSSRNRKRGGGGGRILKNHIVIRIHGKSSKNSFCKISLQTFSVAAFILLLPYK
jgi:hypothetical protein